MSEEKVMSRVLAVVGAVLIQLALGAIYAWSAFTGALKDEGWSTTDTQWVFSIGLATFAVVMVIAGRLFPKLGPTKLSMMGGIVLGIGYILGGAVDPFSKGLLIVFIGIVGGAGIGLAYVVPIKVGMSWYPDKKGLITGLAVSGFGFGATIWVYLVKYLIPATSLGTTFIIVGVLFLVMVVGGGVWMRLPPEGWLPEGMKPAAATPGSAAPKEDGLEISSMEMIKTPQYFMILLTFAFSAMSGLMTIGLAKLYPESAMIANGVDAETAASYAALAMAVFYSLFNGIGRIAWGTISDKIGVKTSVFVMCLVQGIFMILFQFMAGVPGLLLVGITVIGFNFGGNFALFPTMTADTFGKKYVAENYGWVFLAYGIGGIVGPLLGGYMGDQGQFEIAFIISGILTLVSAAIAYLTKPPQKA